MVLVVVREGPEFPRVDHIDRRPTVQVTLRHRTCGTPTRQAPATVSVPRMRPPPDIIRFQERLYVRRSDELYAEANVWPLIEMDDGIA